MTKKRAARPPRVGGAQLRNRLHAAEAALRAIRAGEVDALVVDSTQGEHVIILPGAELAYRILFDQMNEGAVTVTCDGVIAYCNRRFAEIMRLPLGRIIGVPLRRFVSPADDEVFETMRQEGGRRSARGDLHFIAGDGTALPVAVSLAPLHAEGSVEAIGVVGVVRDISERKQHDDIRTELIKQVLTAQDEERRRIARELHDETGQSLTALLVGLRTIEEARSMGESAELAQRLRGIVAQTLEEVGRLSRGLHPGTLDDAGLSAALTRQVQEFVQVHGIAADLRTEGLDAERLPPLLEITVYRVLQESLTNVARHAGARRVQVRLVRDEERVELSVQDDGIGIDSAARAEVPGGNRRRLGLQGMLERAALLGGSVEVESQPGAGTRITACFPLPAV